MIMTWRPNRRDVLRQSTALVGVGIATGILGGHTLGADMIKVAGIYTQPLEQQWIGKIHKALSEFAVARRYRLFLFGTRRQR